MQMGNILKSVWDMLVFVLPSYIHTCKCIIHWMMLIVQYKNDKWASAQREFNNPRICIWAAKREKLIMRKYQRLQYSANRMYFQLEIKQNRNLPGRFFILYQYSTFLLILAPHPYRHTLLCSVEGGCKWMYTLCTYENYIPMSTPSLIKTITVLNYHHNHVICSVYYNSQYIFSLCIAKLIVTVIWNSL